MNGPLIVSAPGKVILHGEHAVVYGKAALATSVDLRCYLVLIPTEDKTVSLYLPDLVPDSEFRRVWSRDDLQHVLTEQEESSLVALKQLAGIEGDETSSIISMATLVFLYLLVNIYKKRLGETSGLSATIISSLPAGAGLGSSAAYSVCLAAGFLSNLRELTNRDGGGMTPHGCGDTIPSEVKAQMIRAGIDLSICGRHRGSWTKESLEVINEWGLKAEKLIHGTPSGIDNSISTYGGAIHFQSGVVAHLENMPRIRILLINTKVPRSTKKMVAGVREKYDKFTSVISPILDAINAITDTAQNLLEQASEQESSDCPRIYSRLEEIFCLNQHLLNALGVGHPAIDKVCTLASSLGLSAKLTGGGGGGCVIALIPKEMSSAKLSEVEAAFQESGFECWETVIGSHGACLHAIS